MRWFRIRRANSINADLRRTFEQLGPGIMQVSLAVDSSFKHNGEDVWPHDVLDSLLPWLTEQYHRAERKETWSITMEAAITVFVLAELLGLGQPLQRFVHYLSCLLLK
jgi:hypothetical protein